MNKEHGSISLDFNLPLEDTSLYSQFDLVTDHGACEHAFNIAETYRTMHRLCKPKGLIVIAQSLWGGNGYFLYDESFFDGIAAANNYKIIFKAFLFFHKRDCVFNSIRRTCFICCKFLRPHKWYFCSKF